MPAKDFYVAIELGSSKITGIAGQKKMDGSVTVIATATEEAAASIRKGIVYNIDKTSQAIRNIVQKLQNQLQTEIIRVHVGVGGQGIRSVLNTITSDLDQATVISNAIADTMNDHNRSTQYPGQMILDVATQEYRVDSQLQIDPVGIECNRLEGNFLNIIWRESFYRNLNKCFEQQDMPQAYYYLAPMALADSVLSDSERRSGCVLVDLGSGTTTVSVYYKNILRHMVTIPLGGDNLTKDIASFHIDEAEAEKMKLKYAAAYTSPSEVDLDMKLSIDPNRSILQRDFITMVEARTEEIIKNALAQIPSEYADKLMGGIILTGGMSCMKNMEAAVRKYSNIDKIRIARTVNISVTSKPQNLVSEDGTMCTAIALIAKADQLSSGRPLSEVNNLFSEEQPATHIDEETRPGGAFGPGKVPTGRELRAKEEEEERRRQEQEAKEAEERRLKEEEERKRKEEEEQKRRENSIGRKLMRGLKRIVSTVTEPEDE